jgi:hypothetical protein
MDMYCYVESTPRSSEDVLSNHTSDTNQNSAPQGDPGQSGIPVEKLIHLALPVRLTHNQDGGRGAPEMSCTYDIHPRGARLLSKRDVKVGDFLTVERGRIKSVCQVVWTADPASTLRGQFTVECVEGKVPWEDELRQMTEHYLPVLPIGTNAIPNSAWGTRGEGKNRRRRPRFAVDGSVDVAEIGGSVRVEGRLKQISEFGCLIGAGSLLEPGAGLRLVLDLCNVTVALRGSVRYTLNSQLMGVEFQEIRQGDRPLLDYVLEQVKRSPAEDFSDLEVITENLAAAQ